MADEFAIEVRAQLETAIEHLAKRATFLEDRGARRGERWGGLVPRSRPLGNWSPGTTLRCVCAMPFAAPAIGKAIPLGELPIAVQLGGTVDGTYRYERPLLVHLVEN